MKTQKSRIIERLKKRWLTVEQAVDLRLGHDLRARISEYKRAGYNVKDKWITLASGTKIKAWRIEE